MKFRWAWLLAAVFGTASALEVPRFATANLVLGQPDFLTAAASSTPADTSLENPAGIAVDSTSGKVFVADTANNRVLRFDNAAGKTSGADADGVLGQGQDPQAKFTSSAALHDQNGFTAPAALAMDSSGTLWVADRGNHRVFGFPSAATVSDGTNAARIIGQPDFNPTSNTAGTAANRLSSPSGVFVDARGGLWILDTGNNRALRFTSFNINEAAATVVGQSGFASSATGLDARHLAAPALGIFTETSGTLWIADTGHHRVLRFAALDNTPPTVRIRGRARVQTSRARIVLRGSASDDVAVTQVQLQVGRKKPPPPAPSHGGSRSRFPSRAPSSRPGRSTLRAIPRPASASCFCATSCRERALLCRATARSLPLMTATLSPDSTMQELLQALPGAQRALFRLYHIGGCASCGFRPDETVAEVCARNENLDPAKVLAEVEEACAEDAKLLIEPKEADAAPDARFLDIRTREEFDAVRIPQSHHFTQDLLQEIMGTWPKDALIVLVDHQGARSLDAAAYFAGHGFANIRGLRGGIDAWSLEVDPSLPRYTVE